MKKKKLKYEIAVTEKYHSQPGDGQDREGQGR